MKKQEPKLEVVAERAVEVDGMELTEIEVEVNGEKQTVRVPKGDLAAMANPAPDLGLDSVPYLTLDSKMSTFRVEGPQLLDNEDGHELAVNWDAAGGVYTERQDYAIYLADRAAGRAEHAARAAAAAPATLARTKLQRERDAARRALRVGKKR